MGWRRTGHRKRLGIRRHHWTRFRYGHHRAEERDRSDVTAESRNRQARSTAMAWGRFSGRWRQFKSVGQVEFFTRPNYLERRGVLGLATARPNLPVPAASLLKSDTIR